MSYDAESFKAGFALGRVLWRPRVIPVHPEPTEFFITFASRGSFTLATYNGGKNWNGILEYSQDKETWTEWDGQTTLSSSGQLYMRGTGATTISGNSNKRWVITASRGVTISGNLECLVDYGTVEQGQHPAIQSYCFAGLFSGNTSITAAPDMPFPVLAPYCFQGMYYGCTSLAAAPELPALAAPAGCYYTMFAGCTSLAESPEIRATSMESYCCYGMFAGCTALIVAHNLMAATVPAHGLESMYSGCTSLTTPPDISATRILDSGCWSMFSGCSSLEEPPDMSQVTVMGANGCREMFYNCIHLLSAPDLTALNMARYCYCRMFEGCAAMVHSPRIKATSMNNAAGCCLYMLYNCVSLADLPELAPTWLYDSCYAHMFEGCINVRVSDVQGGIYVYPYRIPASGTGTVGGNSLYEMFEGTGGAFTGTPQINTIYYTDHAPVS